MATDITHPFEPSPQPSCPTAAAADPTTSATDSVTATIDAESATPNIATNNSAIPPASITPRPPEPDAEVIHIPSYSRWFSWNAIHECEVRFVPEFFDGRSPSKNPKAYKFYRNAIIRRFRDNPTRKITFTEVRKTIVGDVGSIRRIFDFLEAWGLINFTGSNLKQPQLKWEDKETKSTTATSQSGEAPVSGSGNTDVALLKNRLCSGCKTRCTISCFASDKAAFLSTLVGVDVAEVAARASVTALSDLVDGKNEDHFKDLSNMAKDSEIASNGTMEGALAEAKLQLEKHEEELEKEISGIAVQTKEIEDKIVNFEEVDLQIERKWKQLQLLQNLLFVDQLTLLFHQSNESSIVENTGSEAIKID